MCVCVRARVCVCAGAVRAALTDHERAASAIEPRTPTSAVSSACTATKKRRYISSRSRPDLSTPQPRWRDRTAVRSRRLLAPVRIAVGARPRGATRGARRARAVSYTHLRAHET